MNHAAVRTGPDDGDAATLLARAVEGNAAAQREILERYYPLVHRFMSRSLGPGVDPEDFTQDVFLEVFRALRKVRKPEALRSFVFAVAHNLVRTEMRRRRIVRFIGFGEASHMPTPHSHQDPDGVRAMRHLYSALDRLKSREHEVFTLRFLVGLRLTEVAETAGCSLATAKRALSSAVERISDSVRSDPFLAAYLSELDEGGADGSA